ncbi:hypothetical protein RN01_00885 [Cupriavidus sp. SHE]|jgi:hypothetical protein|nr:hypothetical protein RN01_00885 [Cupriavidus sp. SHE]
MLARLSALRRQVQAISREARDAAAKTAPANSASFHAMLAGMLDDWIRQSSGAPQIVCLAAAAELGVAERGHLDMCSIAALQGQDADLRVLYWIASRRISARAPRAGRAPVMGCARHEPPSSPGVGMHRTTKPCRACIALIAQSRTQAGHDQLYPTAMPESRRLGQKILMQTRQYGCATCRAAWTRHQSSCEPFAYWVMLSSARSG